MGGRIDDRDFSSRFLDRYAVATMLSLEYAYTISILSVT